jgi:hypothetical protein
MKFVKIVNSAEGSTEQWGPLELGSAACSAGLSPEHALTVFQVIYFGMSTRPFMPATHRWTPLFQTLNPHFILSHIELIR